jgi:hypothetical protein
MGEAGLEVAQAICCSNSALRMRRSFDSVNVEMIRERMPRVQLQHRIERGDDLLGARVRLTFNGPLVPRSEVHHRFREQRTPHPRRWGTSPDFTHHVGISLIERNTVFGLRMRVVFAEGIDQRSLDF